MNGLMPPRDKSTAADIRVDLSPGREADLWITSVDNENQQVGPGRPTSPRPQKRPSCQRATQSAASANSSSDVPGNKGRTCPGPTSARGYEPR